MDESISCLKKKFVLTQHCPGSPFSLLDNEGKEENGYVEYVDYDEEEANDWKKEKKKGKKDVKMEYFVYIF